MSYFEEYEKIKKTKETLVIGSIWRWSNPPVPDSRTFRIVSIGRYIPHMKLLGTVSYEILDSNRKHSSERTTTIPKFMGHVIQGELERVE